VKIIVIIPTFNEKENISKLIPVLQEKFKEIDHEMGILVVDDSSPDGTAEAVKELMEKYKNVSLITGRKKGLGAAYIRGMKHAMEELKADAVMEMDADFSHKPEDMKRLIAALDTHDFVIGSRYVPGGSIPDSWSFIRRMNSKWGNIFARYVAGLYRVRDCTAGFRAIKTELLEKIDLDHLRVKGYSFQMNLLRAAVDHGASVKEVPVDFVDRMIGESKLQLSDQIEFIFAAWIIRFEKSETFLKFGIVGASGVIVNLGAFNILLGFGLNEYIASLVAIELSIISNFLLNNYWTFAARQDDTHLGIRGLKFNLVSFVALGVSYTTFVILRQTLPNLNPTFAQAAGIIPATLVNYFLNTYFTWKGKGK
jgi:dolichol-phosphate mannosyltransferase